MPEPRIRVLPPELADQIAAGEVIERPASVVKELLENALDAGARRIDIEVEAGGRRLIRVVDDGCGMTPEEARLALLRHATSKLRAASELACLRTLGFRGEALPSIAAVSRLVLTSRPAGELSAWRIEVVAGALESARAAGAPEGTCVEVRDLLYNMPARLKFLKSEPTEAAHITEVVGRAALAWPAVHFRLKHGARIALDVPPHAESAERARAVTGRELHPAQGEEAGIQVRAFLAPPSDSQATARSVHLYVDGRYVRDRGLGHAVVMGYGELLERGRYPVAVVQVTPPAGSVDVNVHPQKIEVRFARPQEVYAAVRHTVARAVAAAPWLDAQPQAVRVYSMPPPPSGPERARAREAAASYAGRAQPPLAPPAALAPEPTAPAAVPAAAGARSFFGALRYIGQLAETYLVCEGAGELVLIDQHAAHERVAFSRLREAHARREMRRQRLLFPVLLELQPGEQAAASEHAGTLEALGFDLEPFGETTLAVKAVPEALGETDPASILRDMLSELGARAASEVVKERIDHMLATMACHSVVRAGDLLGPAEARALLNALDGVDFRGHCPHGRPVVVRMPLGELERRFGRT